MTAPAHDASSSAAPQLAVPLSEVAALVGGSLVGPGTGAVTGLQTVQDAGASDLTFIGDEHHARLWATSRALAAVVSQSLAASVEPTADRSVILVPNADNAMIAMLERFAPPEELPQLGVHPSATIDPSAKLGRDVRIGPGVSIGRNVSIGDGASLHPGVVVYHDAIVGPGCILHANVVIRERCVLGRRVVLHGGVQIGTDGFGYRASPDGRGMVKVPHLGNVVLEDDVEIGANACVDRGKFGATLIGAGTKIDNLVQIGHNCRIGRCVVISGLSGIAGSTTIGDGTRIGGGAGIADHLRIGRGVSIGARSGVMNDIPDGETWAGYPAKDARRAMQEVIAARKLPEYMKNLKEILGPEAAKLLEHGREKPARERALRDKPAS
jgi:UDP-3-O-[3-hydroxymyristoyl] glucosamine N-acyltransferase